MKQKNIINVIKSLEDREILLKETARKNNNQEGGQHNFFCPINKRCFTINKKNELTPLAKSVLVVLELMAAASAPDAE